MALRKRVGYELSISQINRNRNYISPLLNRYPAPGADAIVISYRWERCGAVEVPDGKSGSKKPILVSFEKIENIIGANVQLLQLTTKEKSEKFSSGGYGTEPATTSLGVYQKGATVRHAKFSLSQ